MQEALAGLVGLHPFAVDDELGDGALADILHQRINCAGRGFNINFGEGDVVLGKEALGLAAIAAPVGGVDEKFHPSIFADLGRRCTRMSGAFPGNNLFLDYCSW